MTDTEIQIGMYVHGDSRGIVGGYAHNTELTRFIGIWKYRFTSRTLAGDASFWLTRNEDKRDDQDDGDVMMLQHQQQQQQPNAKNQRKIQRSSVQWIRSFWRILEKCWTFWSGRVSVWFVLYVLCVCCFRKTCFCIGFRELQSQNQKRDVPQKRKMALQRTSNKWINYVKIQNGIFHKKIQIKS